MNEKLKVTKEIIDDITALRKKAKLSSYHLSEQCGKSKYWFQNLECMKTQKITLVDLRSIYNILLPDFSEKDIEEHIQHIYKSSSYCKEKEIASIICEFTNFKNVCAEIICMCDCIGIEEDSKKDILDIIKKDYYGKREDDVNIVCSYINDLDSKLFSN